MRAQSAADIGQVVTVARRHKGMTQAQLAAAVGTTQTWVSMVEQGKETAQIGKVLRLLTYLGVRLQIADAPWIEQKTSGVAPGPSLTAILESHATGQNRRRRKP